ncbi:hypothetical protein LguiA_026636 [Lonicera macranthoides]
MTHMQVSQPVESAGEVAQPKVLNEDSDNDCAFENLIEFGSELVDRVETQSSWAENQNNQSSETGKIEEIGKIHESQ